MRIYLIQSTIDFSPVIIIQNQMWAHFRQHLCIAQNQQISIEY